MLWFSYTSVCSTFSVCNAIWKYHYNISLFSYQISFLFNLMIFYVLFKPFIFEHSSHITVNISYNDKCDCLVGSCHCLVNYLVYELV